MGFGDSITDIELSSHKVMLHAARLEALASGEDVLPVTVEVDLVDHCNHHCGWCVDPRHGRNRLTPDFVRRLLGELRKLGIAGIVYKGGGEPTLHASFAQMLEAAQNRGFEVGVVTNGSRLVRLAEVLASHANYVRVSIDGPTPRSHRAIHGTKDFNRIITGVERLVGKRTVRKQRHPIIGLSFAMDISIVDLLDESIRLGDRLGVDYVLFRPPFFEEAGHRPTMSPLDACEVRRRFHEAKKAYRGRMQVLVDHWVSDRDAAEIDAIAAESPRRGSYVAKNANGIEHVTGRCLASPLLAVVAADRNVYPCCNLRGLEEWSVGRIDYRRKATFQQVWKSPRRQEVLAEIHRFACVRHCTHPLSRYNEIIEYLKSARYHGSFV